MHIKQAVKQTVNEWQLCVTAYIQLYVTAYIQLYVTAVIEWHSFCIYYLVDLLKYS